MTTNRDTAVEAGEIIGAAFQLRRRLQKHLQAGAHPGFEADAQDLVRALNTFISDREAIADPQEDTILPTPSRDTLRDWWLHTAIYPAHEDRRRNKAQILYANLGLDHKNEQHRKHVWAIVDTDDPPRAPSGPRINS